MDAVQKHLDDLRAKTPKDIHPLIDQLEAVIPRLYITHDVGADIFQHVLCPQKMLSLERPTRLPEITVEYLNSKYTFCSPITMSFTSKE